MLVLLLICGAILFFTQLCFVLIMRKRLPPTMVLGICIVSVSVSAFFPLRYVLTHSLIMEPVSVTALGEKNDASLGTEVTIRYFDTNYTARKLDNPVQGQWAWWNGTYKWSEAWEEQGLHPTDTVVMDIPVGNDRSVTFSTGPSCGKAEVSCLDKVKQVDLFSEAEGVKTVKLPNSQRSIYIKARFQRAAVFAGVEIAVLLLVTAAAVCMNRKTNWRVLLKWKYEALVFLLSLMNLFFMGWYPRTFDYPISYYFMPYEGGFNSRGVTGALTMLLGGPYVSQKGLASFVFWLLAATYLFGSILIVRLAKKEADWRMGVFWVLLYLLTPFPFLQIYDDARPDIYLILLFVTGVILINKNRLLQLMPVLCVAMLLFNETSCMFFVATLLALLLYCFVKEREAGYGISFVSSAAFTCFTALRIMGVDKSGLIPVDSYYAHMRLHTDVTLNSAAFAAEYKDTNYLFMDFAAAMGNQQNTNYQLLINTILFFIMVIPFAVLLAMLWKAVYKRMMAQYAGEKASVRYTNMFLFAILLLSSCGGLACMLIAYDYLRFTEFIMIAAMACMFTLIHKEKLTVQVSDLYLFTPPKREFPAAPFAILLYMNVWGTIDVWPRNTVILENIAQVLRDFFGL